MGWINRFQPAFLERCLLLQPVYPADQLLYFLHAFFQLGDSIAQQLSGGKDSAEGAAEGTDQAQNCRECGFVSDDFLHLLSTYV